MHNVKLSIVIFSSFCRLFKHICKRTNNCEPGSIIDYYDKNDMENFRDFQNEYHIYNMNIFSISVNFLWYKTHCVTYLLLQYITYNFDIILFQSFKNIKYFNVGEFLINKILKIIKEFIFYFQVIFHYLIIK